MTRVLYVITAHTNPTQVCRLVDALLRASPQGEVLLHYDPSGPTLPRERLADSPRVFVYPSPRAVRWGDFSLVSTMLDMMTWARERLRFDWLVWISGQDYPLGPLTGFEQTLDASHDAVFRHFPALDHPGWPPREGLKRYYFRYWDLPRFAPFHRLPARVRDLLGATRRWLNEHQPLVVLRPRNRNSPSKIGIRSRRTPFSATRVCYGGWSWLNINARCVERILSFVREHPDYTAYYRRTLCPDESYFHTILLNQPDLTIRNEPLRHVAWGDVAYPSHPVTIVSGNDLQQVLDSGMPFARKFDETVDTNGLDLLDARIDMGTSSPAVA